MAIDTNSPAKLRPEQQPADITSAHYLHAAALVTEWMNSYRQYLVSGDPATLHPKARVALASSIALAFDTIEKKRMKDVASKARGPRGGEK